MLFDNSSTDSHNQLDVLTFEPNEATHLVQYVKEYISSSCSLNELLYKNYQNIDFSEFIAISLFFKKSKIKGFSTVWKREFYPKDTVRIFNRWWEDKSIRKNTNTVCSLHTLSAFKHQIYYTKKNHYTWAFISREKNRRVIERIAQEITQRSKYNLKFHDKKIAVCHPKASSCWQWVAYTNLTNSDEKWGMLDGKKIT